MIPLENPRETCDWKRVIDSFADDRCDFDILLRDEWRHRVLLRDDRIPIGERRKEELVIGGEAYSALAGFLQSHDFSFAAIALAAFHSALAAHGHGERTVIAYLDYSGADTSTKECLLPTIFDHKEQTKLTCREVIECFECAIKQPTLYTRPDALLGRGYFDSSLVWASSTDFDMGDSGGLISVVVGNDHDARRLVWTIDYAYAFIEKKTVESLSTLIRETMFHFMVQSSKPLSEFEPVCEEQKMQLEEWNCTDGGFPTKTRLESLFEEAAAATPTATAVVDDKIQITYSELDGRSNQFAQWFVEIAGVKPQDIIAMMLDKSELIIIATLGTWKAGAAYLPIDPSYPMDRVRFMLRDTGATLILTNRAHAEALRSAGLGKARIVELESVLDTQVCQLSNRKPKLSIGSQQVAYITYTSGTTGVPKGMAKLHANVVNSITDLSERYGMRHAGEERVALFSSFVFEPFMRQTLIALVNSQTLVIVPDEIRLDPIRLPHFLDRHSVTYLNGTGSALQHFDYRVCSSLDKILLVGEELTGARLKKFRETFKGTIINEYSFSETAFVTAIKSFPPEVSERTDRSIGRPLRNVKCYVLGRNLMRLPIGAIGELYIGGQGIARGYLNRDDLTIKSFLPNPHQTKEEQLRQFNARIYKTGDLARMLPNGEIEFLGRSDFQLKISGVRVEPGEIEARIAEYPGVTECIVLARDVPGRIGERRLVGYYVANPDADIAEENLRTFLRERLIPVMIPTQMIRMDRFPLNANGKVDRLALPEPEIHECFLDDHTDHHEDLAASLRRIWGSVLGISPTQIALGDDFFRLGGQSISCILLIARIWRHLRRAIRVEDAFRLRTLDKMAEHLARNDSTAPTSTGGNPATDPVLVGGSLPTNSLQQGLLYHALKRQPGDDAYVVQSEYRYHTKIQPHLMQEAWRHAQRRFPGLRLRFELAKTPIQIAEPDPGTLDWRYVDLSDYSSTEEQEARLGQLRQLDLAEPYCPLGGRLFRVYLIKHRLDCYTLLFSCHHIIVDGWSLTVLHDEVHSAYLTLACGRILVPAKDTAFWAAQRYWQAHRLDHVSYWTEQINRIRDRGDFKGLLSVPNRYRVSLSHYDRVCQRKSKELELGIDLTLLLKTACATHRVTLHSVLQFVWHKALHAIGGNCTTVVGTIVSGRHMPIDGIESSVGLFINTLPLVVDHEYQSRQCVADAIADIQSAVNAMNAKSVVDLSHLEVGTMKRALFDTLLVLENYTQLMENPQHRRAKEILRFECRFDADRVDHPMAVVCREKDDDIVVTLWYASEIFDDSALDTLLNVARNLFVQVAADMLQPVRALEFLTSPMVAQLAAWNRTEANFADGKTLSAVFEESATNWPENIAVVFNEICLTYRELNNRANQLARHLRALTPLRSDDLIALVMDKSELMVLAILAIWKAGAAYVPIDAEYPDERVTFMLDDTDACLVLANQKYVGRLQTLKLKTNRPVVAVEDTQIDEKPCANLVAVTRCTDLAYAIYTSGTTGQPKAVLVEHRGVVNLQSALTRLFQLDRRQGEEAVLSFSNYVFDHFVEVIVDALLNGQKLVILDDRMRTDEGRLCRYLIDNQVTYLSGTPSVLSLYDFSTVRSLSRIDLIGEDLTESVFAKIRETFSHGVIVNGYGPTEISITSHKRLYGPNESRFDKSIGFPIANTTCYVLNDTMKRVPIGGVGELYIGGVGVARGYMGRADLTAERFLDNPFRTPEDKLNGRNQRIYKTGDLVRWLPDGEIEYLGRTDMQVKIHGQRVELGEIESVLASYPDVMRAVVVARQQRNSAPSLSSHKYLVGYYISNWDLDEHKVKRWMHRKLPGLLVPARIMRIDEIPVTRSGKLDIGRLPEGELGPDCFAPFRAPSTDVEVRLCGLWARILGIDPETIGVNDDFFTLGGDSIRAMTLAQSVTTAFDCNVGVGTVIHNATISAQATNLLEAIEVKDHSAEIPPQDVAKTSADHPRVSFAQERLLFIDRFEGGTCAYNVPFALRLEGVSHDTIVKSVNGLVCRHAALRTLIRTGDDGLLRQCVLRADDASGMFKVAEYTVGTTVDLDLILAAEAEHIFRLGADLPFLASVIYVAEIPDATFLSLVFHHTCFDGWSWGIFRQELGEALRRKSELELPVVRATYADFAVWQRQYLSGHKLRELTEYWSRVLAGFEPVRLPTDLPRPLRFDYRGRELSFHLDAETTDGLRALARSVRVSLYSVLAGAWCLMLRVYTGQQDLIVGTPVANRGRPEFGSVVGLVANLLAIRVAVSRSTTLADYLHKVGTAIVYAQIHGELPFEQIIKALDIEPDYSRHPLVQVIFTLLPWAGPIENDRHLEDYTPRGVRSTAVKFDLSATLQEVQHGLVGTVAYAASLFRESTVRGFIATFELILMQLSRHRHMASSVRLDDISWVQNGNAAVLRGSVTAAAKTGWNTSHSLHGLFERATRERPDEVAVVCGDTRLTFDQLNRHANRLANYLRATVSLNPGDLVALVLEKSELMIVAMLAVWKAGAGYMPIDSSYPDDRIGFMLEDTRSRLVLTQRSHQERLAQILRYAPLAIVDLDSMGFEAYSSENLVCSAPDVNLAYAIYTSGSTGQPKAVLVTHRNAVSFCASVRSRFLSRNDGSRESVLFLANYVFDFSIEQMALSILSGGKLVIPPPTFGPDFCECAAGEELTYISGTPTQIQRLELARFKHLRAVLAAGESFLQHHFDHIRSQYAGPIYNAYGTTETTVYNTVKCFAPEEAYSNDLGDPLPNTRLYVLDDALKPLPPGACGEVYLAGECVSDGYLNRPALTRARFVPNHLQTDAERQEGRFPVLYKTGDMAKVSQKGELQFMGRNDRQVKIRGLRIEPGEIETAIASCPGVKDCAVVVYDDDRVQGKKQLVAYYVADMNSSTDDEKIVTTIRAKLSLSMVPSLLVRMDRPLPMTINGKLDGEALPRVALSAARVPYAAPRNRLDARLCRLWEEQLPQCVIGIDDDFFRSGGDSIGALQLATRVQRDTGFAVSVNDIFDFPSVRALVDSGVALHTRQPRDEPQVYGEQAVCEPLRGECPLLPIQRWFFAKPLSTRARWNQAFAICTPPLETDRLCGALSKLVSYHDAFRLRFRDTSSGPLQFYATECPAVVLRALDVRDQSDAQIENVLSQWQSNFDLESGPTYCAGYLHGFKDGSARIWFSMHHLIVDVVSWRVITQDLEILYHGGSLGARHTTYREWVQAVQNYRHDENERRLWKSLAEHIAADRSGRLLSAHLQTAPCYLEFRLTVEETHDLLTQSSRAYDSDTRDLLMTAVGYGLHELTGLATNHITVEGHGREVFEGAPEVRDNVGWFTTMYPLTLEVGHDLESSVLLTKASRQRVPAGGIGYSALCGTYGGEGAPLPLVSFNYLGRFAPSEKRPAAPSTPWRLDSSNYMGGRVVHGEAASDSSIDITMSCFDEQFTVEVDSRLDEAATRRFTTALQSSLRKLAAEAVAKPKISASRNARGAARVSPQDIFVPHILINGDAHGATLFVLPPGEGGAESYLSNIARDLSGHRLVLFNNMHLHTPGESFEALAEYYVGKVREIQSTGPYNILGWSYGGVLSLEMANQLARAGERIRNLLLIDPYFNVTKALEDLGLPTVAGQLDPINYNYRPIRSDLDRLSESISTVVLFKADRSNEIVASEDQRRLFEQYRRARYNYLDSLLPNHAVRVELLHGQSHHSWVGDTGTIQAMSHLIKKALESK